MRFATSISAAALSFADMITAAAPHGRAIIQVEASHGGAGSDLTNTTIIVPVGQIYSGDKALDTVSTLYLDAALGVSSDTITCTPYKESNGKGNHGEPFTTSQPSYLSTNTVVIGSIVCNSDA